MDFDGGLRLLWSDKNILDMFNCVAPKKILHIYVEHPNNIFDEGESFMDVEVIAETPIAIKETHNSLQLDDICGSSDRGMHIEELLNLDYDGEDDDELFIGKFDGVGLNLRDGGVGLHLENEELCNSECGSFSHLNSPIQSDDDVVEGSQKYVEFHPSMLKDNIEFTLGMKFGTLTELRDAIREYSLRSGHELIYQKNEPERVTVRCQDGCNWRLHASNRQDEYLVRKDFNINISRHQAYRARKIAMHKLEGTVEMQYAKLRDYCEELWRSNPDSSYLLSVDRRQIHMQPIFKSMYICLTACKNGFLQSCRPIIGLDGCHLKTTTQGQLLTAVGIDANEGIFPLALAVVDVESKESWTWFLENLLDYIGPVEKNRWVFMTDQQKGLIPAIEKVAPNAEHRICGLFDCAVFDGCLMLIKMFG
ncbi:uncharacterized protein LOC111023558 [Momordica charantia]|uniref:Uncharacterized protein LOC111023558 n=1 Tax=Momordica charantia TaxID=3673 RepID=A0A6J1DRD2_MOMCH|nr:uncharacterized protein LOC111023558 [Momordica charantia]